MKFSVVIPLYDDLQETSEMIQAVQSSMPEPIDLEFLIADVRGDWRDRVAQQHFPPAVRYLSASNLPAAKTQAAMTANGEFLLYLFPGIFPTRGAIDLLLACLEENSAITAVAGRWSNASGKLEVGYNVRRFPTLTALIYDILLLNKLFPHNPQTRAYKMHDFDHNGPIRVEHANDCVLMLRREAVLRHGGFNSTYAPGWFDQVEFCQSLNKAGEVILYEPRAQFVSNSNVPLIDRLVRDRYAEYRSAERLYIRNHFGAATEAVTRLVMAIGMLERIAFTLSLPVRTRKWLLSRLRSYVDDDYIRQLRSDYWSVLKKTLWR
jgi:GT2 family glycosyltransferase